MRAGRGGSGVTWGERLFLGAGRSFHAEPLPGRDEAAGGEGGGGGGPALCCCRCWATNPNPRRQLTALRAPWMRAAAPRWREWKSGGDSQGSAVVEGLFLVSILFFLF